MLLVVSVTLLLQACGFGGGGYGQVREEYLNALFDADYGQAFGLLCPAAKEHFGSADSLGEAFESIVDEHHFTDSWASLRGESDNAYTTFLRLGGTGQYTGVLPVEHGKVIAMCPAGDEVLGRLRKD